MGIENYELLKGEIPTIAELLKMFPEPLHEKVFELLVTTLLDRPLSPISSGLQQKPTDSVALGSTPDTDRNVVGELVSFYKEKDPSEKLNDMEFAALVAYFFAKEAPQSQQKQEMTEELLLDACIHVGRKPPVDPGGTLNNARHRKKYFDSAGRGKYRLNHAGEHFVKTTLPKKTR